MEINLNNYEEYFLTYVDGELDEATSRRLMQFLEAHPDRKKELNLLQMTVLPEEQPVHFPDKQLLYRKVKSAAKKVFILRRYPRASVAAAACVALLAVFYFQFQKQDEPAQRVAVHATTQTSYQSVKPAIVKQDTVSRGRLFPGEQKRNVEHPKEKTNSALAIASPDSQGKNTYIQKEKQETGQGVSLPQKGTKDLTTGNTLPQLPVLPASPVTPQEPAVNAPIIEVALGGEKHAQANVKETTNHRAKGRKLLADHITKRHASFDNKIIHAAFRFSMAKEEMDSTITQKLTDMNQKTSGLITHIAKNGIKIGHITFAFNN